MSKINERILFIFTILCIFIIIPCSFASDLDDNSTLSDGVDIDENSIYVSVDGDDTGGTGSEESPYQSISKAVESYDPSVNSNILVKNGTYVFDGSVTINKQVTIVGESNTGVVLDGNHSSKILVVDSSNVKISSLTFVNAYCENSYGSGGSAIFSDSDNLIVDNCIFDSNEGGAVTATGGNVLINNCVFVNNVAEGWAASGSAYSIMAGSSNVTNCQFINNTAEYGGTVFASNGHRKEYFYNCTFIGNKETNSKDGGGSAIYMYNMYDDVTIINCVFKDNTAESKQPVIDIEVSHFYVDPILYLKNNTFENNYPTKEIDTNMNIVYLGNNDHIDATNIIKDYGMEVGDDENFTVTLTDTDGNGIPDKLITITFTDYIGRVNSYTAYTNEEGKAIISLINQTAGTFTVVSSFAGDSDWDAVNTTSAVYIRAGNSYNVVFNETIVKAKPGTSHKVMAYICNNYIVPVADGVFSEYEITWDSRTTHGYYNTAVFEVDVYDFDLSIRNEYYYIDFTIHNINDYYVTANGTLIVDTSVPFPPVDKNIDVIYVAKDGSDEFGDGTEENPLATVQTALFVNQEFGGNKVVYVKEGTYEVSNLEVYANVTVIGDKSKTIFKQTVGDDGMLYLDNGATTDFINITFVNGYMAEYSLYGAVIVVRYTGSVAHFDGCEFYNNKGSSDGVIFVNYYAVAYFNNCRFENNLAETFSPAGVIQVRDAYLSVNNSYFGNNTAVEGGAIFVAGDSYANIENTVFYRNNALDDNASRSGGGAIYVNNWNTHITNCSFIENYADLYGGAIYILIGQVEIEKCLFVNNRVRDGDGSAIGSDSGLEIHLYVDHSEFISDDYHRPVYVVSDAADANEIILDNNFWANAVQPGANDKVIIKASTNATEISEGDVIEVTVEFVSADGKALDKPMHDLKLDLIPKIGNVDVSSINIVNNTAKFIYYATHAGHETIAMSCDETDAYRFKFDVDDPTSFKVDVNANITVNDNKTQIIVEVPKNLEHNITIRVDENFFYVKSDNGIATLDVSYLLPGEHKVVVIYEGDVFYRAEISDIFNFTVDKYNVDLKISVDDIVAGEDVIVNISANDTFSGNVEVVINNKTYTVTVSDGHGSTVINTLTGGNYTADVIFEGNDYFASDSASTTFEIAESSIMVLYVSPDGSDDNDGSQSSPYATISKALDRNKRLGGNRTIIVSEGNYILNRYSISNDVRILGQGNVVISQNIKTNHIHIGGNVNVYLENLTFINGVGTQVGSIAMGSDDAGNIGKTLTIVNCGFINNTGLVGVISSYANTTISKSSFINNTATGKEGFTQGIISIQDNTVDLVNNLFLNNNYADEIIVSRVSGLANDNFWSTNDKPNDVSEKLNLTSWICVVPVIDEDIRTKTNYDLVVKFQTTDGANLSDLDVAMPDLSLDIIAANGVLNQSSILISNNVGVANYIINQKGSDTINITIYGNTIVSLEFEVTVPELDKIYVSVNGSDLNIGSKDSPLQTIREALEQNKAQGGNKTIIILAGEYNEQNLIIDTIVTILGENATINGEGKNIFTISADAEISNVKFINAADAIKQLDGKLNILDAEFTNNTNAIVSNSTLIIENVAFNENNNAIVADGEISIDDSEFIQNTGTAIDAKNNAIINNSKFIDNDVALNLENSISTAIKNNTFDNNNVAINTLNAEVTIEGNEFSGESIVLDSSNADLIENTNVTIKLINSTITNTIVTFMDAKTVFVNNGTVKLNATVADIMGNIIDGGKITFTSNGEEIGTANVENGVAIFEYQFTKGNYTISGIFDADANSSINDGLVRVDVDYYWFIGEVGYENLSDAVSAAELGDVIKGIPGTYEIGKILIGHRYISIEPWEFFKSVTITSINDTPVTLKGSGVQMFFVDVGSELTLKNLIIMDAGSSSDDGGAVGTLYNTNLTIINCTFINNTATNGGAVYAFGTTNLEIKDTIFDSNTAGLAGALQIVAHGLYDEAILKNLTFINNKAHFGGAFYNGASDLELHDAKFINNSATIGGALFTNGGSLTVVDSEFIGNKAVPNVDLTSSSMGGAFHNLLGNATFRNVKFINNSADDLGGAMELENGLYTDISWTIIDDCTFENNTAKDGGAIYLGDSYDPYVVITSSVFDSNTAENNGAAISDNFGHLTIDGSKFINNVAGGLDVIHVVGDIFESAIYIGELTISDSEFTANSADYVIFTNNYGILTVSNTKFDTQNITLFNRGDASLKNVVIVNSTENAIENLGNLSLSKNDFDTPILNKNVITSLAYVVILGNETKSFAAGEDCVLIAVITDDNGNIIEGGELTFVVSGKQITAVYQDNEFRANYTVSMGTQIIDAIMNDDGLQQVKVKTATILGKTSSDLSVELSNINVGDVAKITVKVNIKATGFVTVSVNNKSYEVAITRGIAELDVPDLEYGEYPVEVTYAGDENYAPASKTQTLAVSKISDYNINVDISKSKVDNNITINVVLPSDINGPANVIVDNIEYPINISNGTASVIVSDLAIGEHSLTINYGGDAKYSNSTFETTFKVGKVASNITVEVSNIKAGETAGIVVKTPTDATGDVVISVDGEEYYARVSNGKASVQVPNLEVGTHNVLATYYGDAQYLDSSNTATFTVKVKPTIPTINLIVPSVISPGSSATVKVELPKDAKGNVSIRLNGKEISFAAVKDGVVTTSLPALDLGSYSVGAYYYGDDKYSGVDAFTQVTVKKLATHIVSDKAFSHVAVDYTAKERGTYQYGTLLDENDNPVANKEVKITIGSTTYKVKTNSKGVFKLKINYAVAKKYNYKISFEGDDLYDATAFSAKLTVTKKKTSISAAKTTTFKATTKTKTVKVTLKTTKNANGKTYLKAGKKITLKVNGKTYTAKATAKGAAKFAVKLSKKGTYKAVIKFAGDKTYKASSKNVNIKIK